MTKDTTLPVNETSVPPPAGPGHSDSRPRRHSLPSTAALQSPPLTNWRVVTTTEEPPADSNDSSSGGGHSAGSSALRFLRGSVGGHRTSKSMQIPVEQAVTVRSYSPHTASELSVEEEPAERVELPSIDEFTFDGILKAVEPKVARTLETISQLSSSYRSNLTHETDLLVAAQNDIETKITQADRLSAQVLRTTNLRRNRLKADSVHFNGGAVVDDLAKSAEKAYAAIESIVATLQAIDEMLPAQEQLGTVDSAHQKHYPYTHSLLAAKASRNMVVVTSYTVSPTAIAGEHGPSSSRPSYDATFSPGRRGSYFSTLSAYGPSISAQQRRISSPPSLKLRTIVPPSTTAESPTLATPTVVSPSLHNSSVKSSIMPVRERDSLSVATSAAVSARSSFSLKNILWGSSWGRRSGGGSHGSGTVGAREGDTAQAKLKRIIEVQRLGKPDASAGSGSA